MKKIIPILRTQSKLLFVLTAGILAGGASTAVVMASIPDSSGVIHACYKTGLLNNGQMRVIDNSTQSCNANETAISFNSATPGQFIAANMVGADFTNTSLAYRNFAGVDMHGSVFNNSSLNGTNLVNSNLSSSVFNYDGIDTELIKNANLSGANFSSVNFSVPTDFTGSNLFNTNFSSASINWTLTGADLRHAVLNGAYFNATMDSINLSGVDMRLLGGISANFRSSDLSSTNFSGATVNGTTINSSDIVTNANFSNTSFLNSNLNGSDLSHLNVTGAIWSNTVCPDGTNSDNNGNTCMGHLAP